MFLICFWLLGWNIHPFGHFCPEQAISTTTGLRFNLALTFPNDLVTLELCPLLRLWSMIRYISGHSLSHLCCDGFGEVKAFMHLLWHCPPVRSFSILDVKMSNSLPPWHNSGKYTVTTHALHHCITGKKAIWLNCIVIASCWHKKASECHDNAPGI